MSVYVDPIEQWPTRIACFKSGSCHMFADTADELHEMAKNIGLLKSWFQNDVRLPHYDLTPKRRAAAIGLGAKEVTRQELGEILKQRRKSKT